uniref:Uncharacterized protein n=1 Tax=Arundo donax TaxID=35708 RepID=A0A0A9HJ71_ARUDO
MGFKCLLCCCTGRFLMSFDWAIFLLMGLGCVRWGPESIPLCV